MAGRIGRHDKAEAPLVMAVGSDELIAPDLLRRQDHRAAAAEDDPPLVHQIAQGLAKDGVILLLAEVQLLGQPARLLRAIVLALEMSEDFRFQLL